MQARTVMYTSHSQVLERDDQPGDTFYSAGSAIFDLLLFFKYRYNKFFRARELETL